jgi:hypothetical protein
MKHFGMRFGMLLAAAVLATTMAPSALAADSEFDALISSIEVRYQVQHEHTPLVGFFSFCAWIYTRGGVRGFRFADFEDAGARIFADAVDSFVHGQLGASWNVILRSHEKEAKDDTIIYARPMGDKFFVLIAEIDDGQLSLVKLRVNANRLSKWLNNQEKHTKK